MNRPLLRLTAAVVLGALSTIAVSWSFAAFASTAGRSSRQGVLIKADYRAIFGRSDAWGITQVYWRAAAGGDRRWGRPDALVELPRWSRAHRLRAPFPPFEDFPKQAQAFEIATGWPFRAMRAEFRDTPQGTPRPAAGPYTTVRGIPLKTRLIRIGGATIFSPAALPYEPIWPGFAAGTAFFGAYWLVLLLGIPAARRVLRARRGRCAACGYDRSGLAPGVVCPECGGQLADPRRLVRWWPLIPVALAGLLCMTLAAAGGTAAASRGYTWAMAKPVWLLLREAHRAQPAAALEELLRRMTANDLPPETVEKLIADALAIQGDPTKPWEPRWGDLIERARAAGAVSDEQWKTYAGQAVHARLEPRSPVRVGDPVPLQIAVDNRVGHGRWLGMQANVRRPVLIEDGVEPPPSEEPENEAMRFVLRTRDGQLYPWMARAHTYGIRPAIPEFGGSPAQPAVWPRPTHPGRADLVIDLEMQIDENTYPQPLPLPKDAFVRPASAAAITTYTLRLKAPLEVVAADAETVTLIDGDEATRAAIERGIRPVTPNTALSWSPALQLDRRRDGKLYGEGAIIVDSTPIPVAFDIFWRSGDREWPMGSLTFAPGSQSGGRPRHHGSVDGFNAPTVDIILRPSRDAARTEPDIHEIWNGTLIFPNVPVTPPPPAPPPQP